MIYTDENELLLSVARREVPSCARPAAASETGITS